MKRKQKGRNQDINVKDMNNYRELKNKKEEHSKKLEEINGKNDQLKEKSENIKEIIDNLKPASFYKNNKVISNEENEISIKDRIINELKNHQINNLESTIYKLRGFWNAIIKRFKYMVFDEKNGERKDNSYSKVAEDLYVNGVINDYEMI